MVSDRRAGETPPRTLGTETPKTAQERLSTLCRLAASIRQDQRHDFDVLFSPPIMARYEATCGVSLRSLPQYRWRLNLLADIHHGAYQPVRRHAVIDAEPPVEEAPLAILLDEAELPECVVRFLVAGLGAG